MAKSERPDGKRGETHYNRGEGGDGGFKKEGGGERKARSSDGGNEGRPYRKREEGDRKPYRSDAGAERKSYQKKEGDKPFRASRDGGAERKPFRRDDGEGRKPFNREGGEAKRPYKRDDSEGRKPFNREGGESKRPYKRDDADSRKSFNREGSGERKPFRKDEGGERRPYNKEGNSDRNPFRRDDDRKSFGEKKPYRADGEKRPYERRDNAGGDKPFRKSGDRPYSERSGGDRKDGERKPYQRREEGAGERKPYARKSEGGDDRRKSFGDRGDKPRFKPRSGDEGDRKPYARKGAVDKPFPPKKTGFEKEEFAEYSNPVKPGKWDTEAKAGPMTLNKYLAHSGVSSRRDAAAIIKEGKVTVNGEVLTQPGYRVKPDDRITMDGKEMKPQKHFVYVLLNKPKDFITTTEDERGRRTVMELVSGATEDRLYPVGRLDRNTTGVLLLTNDGDLAQKLSHPKYESKKIYQVTLNKDVTKRDFDQILEGVTLEDGIAKVDRLAYLENKNEIGLEIHTGRNRIVRRIFEHLGYEVDKLDRVMYAGLTKKNVTRGKWRFLTEKEVIALKHFRS
jgi:23S rRNA pseudouridine2605 synthase